MSKIYILHSGAPIIEFAINNCKNKENIVMINPTLKYRFLRAIRKLHFLSKMKSKRIWVDNILNRYNIENLKENTIILFDVPIWIENIDYIRKKYDKINIVFWFWNIIKDREKIKNIKYHCNKIFTFDKTDSDLYGLLYNPQFYWDNNKYLKKQHTEFDLLFIGRDKNRISILETVYLKCIKHQLKVNFYVVKDKYSKSKYLDLHKKEIPYSEIIHLINKSKCILDINQKNQTGLTLRVLEAIFFKKKLITNNKDIINYDFYNKNNIFIINEQNPHISSDFIKSEFLEIEQSIIEKYTIDNWIKVLSMR